MIGALQIGQPTLFSMSWFAHLRHIAQWPQSTKTVSIFCSSQTTQSVSSSSVVLLLLVLVVPPFLCIWKNTSSIKGKRKRWCEYLLLLWWLISWTFPSKMISTTSITFPTVIANIISTLVTMTMCWEYTMMKEMEVEIALVVVDLDILEQNDFHHIDNISHCYCQYYFHPNVNYVEKRCWEETLQRRKWKLRSYLLLLLLLIWTFSSKMISTTSITFATVICVTISSLGIDEV